MAHLVFLYFNVKHIPFFVHIFYLMCFKKMREIPIHPCIIVNRWAIDIDANDVKPSELCVFLDLSKRGASIFFAEKSPDGAPIDYHAAISGGLRLVPDDGALAKLADDYRHMVEDGLFLDEVESFDALLHQCRAIQEKANAA